MGARPSHLAHHRSFLDFAHPKDRHFCGATGPDISFPISTAMLSSATREGMKEQVVDNLPKRIKEVKFGIM